MILFCARCSCRNAKYYIVGKGPFLEEPEHRAMLKCSRSCAGRGGGLFKDVDQVPDMGRGFEWDGMDVNPWRRIGRGIRRREASRGLLEPMGF